MAVAGTVATQSRQGMVDWRRFECIWHFVSSIEAFALSRTGAFAILLPTHRSS